jgi:formate hydrogenlyase subunit 3/multisubunit Na+/H+ antiporter MnhD subunit
MRAIEQIALAMFMQQDSPRPKRSPASIALALAGIFGLVGVGFLIAAGYEWMLEQHGLQTARLYTGSVCVTLAVMAAAAAGAFYSYKRAKAETYYMVVRENIQSAIAMLGEELEEPIRENPKTAMLMASLAGYIAAEKLLH